MGKSKIADIISKKDETDYSKNFVLNIRHEMERQGIPVKEISRKSGIAEATLRLRLNEPGTFKLQEIAKICKVLKVSPYKIVSQKLTYTEDIER